MPIKLKQGEGWPVHENGEKYIISHVDGTQGFTVFRCDAQGEYKWFSDGWRTVEGARAFCISRSHAFAFEQSRRMEVRP